MSDVIYRVEHEYDEAASRHRRPEAFTLSMLDLLNPPATDAETEDHLVAKLSRDICDLGKRRGTLTFGQVQDALCSGQWFGAAREKHFRAACKLLVRERKITREKETGIYENTPLTFVTP